MRQVNNWVWLICTVILVAVAVAVVTEIRDVRYETPRVAYMPAASASEVAPVGSSIQPTFVAEAAAVRLVELQPLLDGWQQGWAELSPEARKRLEPFKEAGERFVTREVLPAYRDMWAEELTREFTDGEIVKLDTTQEKDIPELSRRIAAVGVLVRQRSKRLLDERMSGWLVHVGLYRR